MRKVDFLIFYMEKAILKSKTCMRNQIKIVKLFQIVFSPNTVGTKSIDYFHIMPIGNISKTVVKCVGESVGEYSCDSCDHLSDLTHWTLRHLNEILDM